MKRSFLQFSLLNACIDKTGPKALQVSRSAMNLLNISSDRYCSFWKKTSSFLYESLSCFNRLERE